MEALAKLGIDGWGIVLYLVNFGVLMWVLHRYVFVPLAAFLDERRAQIRVNIEEAEALRLRLEEEKAAEEAQRREREANLADRITEAKRVVKEEARSMLTEAEAQREAILLAAGEQRDQLITGALSGAQAETVKRIRQIVTHVLQEGVSEEVVQESVEKSWKVIAKNATYGQ